jgi:preprotein translocase subunit YajC
MLIIYVVLFGAIFYFLAIRPQRRQKAKHQEMVTMLKRGDEVVTIGGMYGTVRKVGPDWVVIEIAPRMQVRFMKRAISSISTPDLEEDEYDEDEYEDEEYADDVAELEAAEEYEDEEDYEEEEDEEAYEDEEEYEEEDDADEEALEDEEDLEEVPDAPAAKGPAGGGR